MQIRTIAIMYSRAKRFTVYSNIMHSNPSPVGTHPNYRAITLQTLRFMQLWFELFEINIRSLAKSVRV